ncbi:MAG: T9SS type A sorting domain-containing protein [Saprospiraceae bacterium]|nr:T9SS type A sorting domain-containing protein [Saprospiraceae bacterium]
MKKTFTLLIMIVGLFSGLNAQTALDPNQFVNTQITGPGVYTVEPGQFYAFDGQIVLTYPITIMGPDEGWIMNVENPAVMVNTPSADGSARQFFELQEGGALTVKNLLWSGSNSNGEIVGTFAQNTAGIKMVVDNCVMTDWQSFTLRNRTKTADSLVVTNSIFINGVRTRYSQWGGFPVRCDVAPINLIFENNTVVNSGRLLCNSGPFHNANLHQIHNTYLNQVVAGEEQRANEFITANNIFHNFHFIGRKNNVEFGDATSHSSPDNGYGSHWTTWNYFADSKLSLDSISLYLGQNLFFRPQENIDFFEQHSDSLSTSLLWEHPDVDSFIVTDDNYTIGANYSQIDPEFTKHPGNIAKTVEYVQLHYLNPDITMWPDWRITQPVSFDEASGAPSLTWPPDFDLTYSNDFLKTAGTDGLPLGDLNWYPDQKAEYYANRDDIIEAIRDSMVNAKVVYDPNSGEGTPLITEGTTSAREHVVPGQLHLTNYPNPFDQRTLIEFGITKPSKVRLGIYDLTGKQIFETVEMNLSAGSHAYELDGSNISSGIYMIKLIATGSDGINRVDSKKIIVSK